MPIAGAQVPEAEILNRGQGFSWYFSTPDHFREILDEIQAGRLLPIETVSLTARASFGDAPVDGYKNLGSRPSSIRCSTSSWRAPTVNAASRRCLS